MITVIHKDGTRIDFRDELPAEYLLAKACYSDNIQDVEEILSEHKKSILMLQ